MVRNSDGSLTGRFNLKSIYGTFLVARVASSKWFGIVKNYEVCQTSMLEDDDGLNSLSYPHYCVVSRSSKTSLNWYDLRITYYYRGNNYDRLCLVPEEGRRHRLVEDLPAWELWDIQVVDNDKRDTSPNKEQQKPARLRLQYHQLQLQVPLQLQLLLLEIIQVPVPRYRVMICNHL